MLAVRSRLFSFDWGRVFEEMMLLTRTIHTEQTKLDGVLRVSHSLRPYWNYSWWWRGADFIGLNRWQTAKSKLWSLQTRFWGSQGHGRSVRKCKSLAVLFPNVFPILKNKSSYIVCNRCWKMFKNKFLSLFKETSHPSSLCLPIHPFIRTPLRWSPMHYTG